MLIREMIEQVEKEVLSEYAVLSCNTKGRKREEKKCDVRTEYQRDRDRILHSKAFRRLKHKTQVFIAPEGDHYRTRLTHTLEVSQIARTIARALRLNEDLTEAIALGHDLGHTPFGHSGEEILDELCESGFKHNCQSLRVVDFLEKGEGLNLTWEVRDGILNHRKDGNPSTLEGKIVSISDRIAYINHDIDDAIRGNIIDEADLPDYCVDIFGNTHSKRIDTMIKDVIQASYNKPYIRMSNQVEVATSILREFMFKKVYVDSAAKVEEEKTQYMLKQLFYYFLNNIDLLPDEMIKIIPKWGKEQVVCDYIAGMTDRFAINKYNDLFIPSPWNKY
ncbi:MAG: deoxyguanosinetriphosphate triphosphohydrolase [Clostridia bacterium]|nr:deoxyguanosinetriphosphate triphosphohydrolase [Clostridia bacterium]